MIDLTSSALERIAVGGILTIVGVLIKFRGWTFLLAGYDEDSPVPGDVVQDMAGNSVLRVGLVVFVVGILTFVMNPPSYLGILVGAVIVLDVLRLIFRLNTWSSQGG